MTKSLFEKIIILLNIMFWFIIYPIEKLFFLDYREDNLNEYFEFLAKWWKE